MRAKGGLIYMSGSGADETISDYGMDGRKLYPHSCFAGVFPANLSEVFPWCSFYYGTQRAYLMKEELTGGAHGIETRCARARRQWRHRARALPREVAMSRTSSVFFSLLQMRARARETDPFLDPKVVQEYLWLTHTLKNSDYKMPVAKYMRDNDFPNAWKEKKGFGGHKRMIARTTITEMSLPGSGPGPPAARLAQRRTATGRHRHSRAHMLPLRRNQPR